MRLIKSVEGSTQPKVDQIGVFWPDLYCTDMYEDCSLQELQEKFEHEMIQPDFLVGVTNGN